jgi:hypothetical protein
LHRHQLGLGGADGEYGMDRLRLRSRAGREEGSADQCAEDEDPSAPGTELGEAFPHDGFLCLMGRMALSAWD